MSEERTWIVYRVGARRYRTPAAAVVGIERYEASVPLPVPSALRGVLPLRGELVALIDLGSRSPSDASPSRLLIVRTPRGLLGVPCNEVEGLQDAEACATVDALEVDALLARVASAGPREARGGVP